MARSELLPLSRAGHVDAAAQLRDDSADFAAIGNQLLKHWPIDVAEIEGTIN
ncbi:hypothetical protein [Thiohalocapsa sp.]|uniref:hypothetical protein n=1 Tax=Thiohalocapsa sp. TaxID=2497641 RepID=UPI0025CF5604|nr:hypothetical protein [Thiohalocapsa sp.]